MCLQRHGYDLPLRLAPYSRQENVPGGAVIDSALHLEMSAILRHNPLHNRQPKTGPLAHVLGRKEWFEQPVADTLVDAGPVVAHRDSDVKVRLDRTAAVRTRAFQPSLCGLDGKH